MSIVMIGLIENYRLVRKRGMRPDEISPLAKADNVPVPMQDRFQLAYFRWDTSFLTRDKNISFYQLRKQTIKRTKQHHLCL